MGSNRGHFFLCRHKKKLKMKIITLLAPIISLTYAESEYCSNGLLSDNESCDEENDLRHIGRSRNMIDLINCPDGVNSANPICKGRKDIKGTQKSYQNLLLQAIKN